MALSGYLLLRQAYNIMGYRSERDKPFPQIPMPFTDRSKLRQLRAPATNFKRLSST